MHFSKLPESNVHHQLGGPFAAAVSGACICSYDLIITDYDEPIFGVGGVHEINMRNVNNVGKG